MNKTITISVAGIIAVLVSIFIGYLIGRSSVKLPETKKEVEIKWKKGDVIFDTIAMPVPYKVIIPDTIVLTDTIKTDTAALYAVWKDYHLERDYNLDFSNDSIGIVKIDAKINQNKLVSATSIIQPNILTITEKETIYKVPTLQIWAMVGTSIDLKTNKMQVGADIKGKFIIGASGLRFNDKFGYTIDLGIKF
ncbi:MAG: hypothetical protein LBM96_05895 [Methanobrevibacter sp.]|jgi:hypothetical protein|nr:hypothetical protein [Candidatus Methanoflexus mossambicus]